MKKICAIILAFAFLLGCVAMAGAEAEPLTRNELSAWREQLLKDSIADNRYAAQPLENGQYSLTFDWYTLLTDTERLSSATRIQGVIFELVPDGDEETPAEPAAPLAAEAPAEQPAQAEAHALEGDCGPRILEALHQIIALLSGPAADCGAAPRSTDEDPSAVTEALAETAAEELAGNVAAAAVEALAETAAPELASGDEEDPVEELVAEILETGEAAGPADPASDEEEEILSGVLEPVEADEGAEEEPEALSRDRAALGAAALREALVSFRPHLQRMSPKQRQRFNADVAARMRKLSRAAGGKPGAYAALRKTGAQDRDGKALGRKIMEARNANLRR